MSCSPTISIIVPIYNVERYLARCLDSILGQSFHDIEVICIDDGSTDGSSEILRRYAKQDERIRVITQANKGVSAARNAGLDIAKGEWLTFVDSDDEVMSDIWKTLLAEAEDEDVICFGVEEVILQGNSQKIIQSGYFDVKFSGRKVLQDEDLFKIPVTIGDKVYRRSRIEKYALRFPEGLCFEDNIFFYNFVSVNRNARFVPQKLYRYFRRDGSITSNARNHKEKLAFDYISVLDHIYCFWKTHGILLQMQCIFERICFNFFRAAIEICLPWERAGIVYALSCALRRWDIPHQNKTLKALKDGNLSIRIGDFPGRDITLLKPLKGFEKILYIGNYQDRKILRLFGFKILSWRRSQRKN